MWDCYDDKYNFFNVLLFKATMMSPAQKKALIMEIPTWTYRALIGGMLTMLLMWFNDFRSQYRDLEIDHVRLKLDFNTHREIQKGEINLINRNIQILSDNQTILFKEYKPNNQ